METSAETAGVSKRTGWPVLVTFAVLSMLVAGCGRTELEPTAGADTARLGNLRGTLDGQGSSFQDTFEQLVSSDFERAAEAAGSPVAVTYTKTGSSDGRRALADQTVSFAGSDSPIKPEERSSFAGRDILCFPIMGGPIAVTYHLDGVDRLDLRAETVARIFQGDITFWDDPAIARDNPRIDLPSARITVVHRSDGSGTTGNFSAFLKGATAAWRLGAGESVSWPSGPSFQGAEKATGVTSVVKTTDGAITYADLADGAKEHLPVARIGNAAGRFIAPTPDAASNALATAEIRSDLTYDPLNAKADDAYPITSPTWILVDAEQRNRSTAALLKAYLRYVLTTGQARAKQLLYAPLPETLVERAMAQIDRITAR